MKKTVICILLTSFILFQSHHVLMDGWMVGKLVGMVDAIYLQMMEMV